MFATLAVAFATMPVSNAATATYNNAVLGVRLEHPAAAAVLEDQHIADTFGFTLVDEALGPAHTPLLLRVAQAQGTASPEQKARELRAQFADLPLQQQSVSFARVQGIAVSGVPGEYSANTYIYAGANGRVYEIIYGRETLDQRGMALLNGLRFTAPRATLASLRLPAANDTARVAPPAAIQQQADQEDAQRAQAAAQAQSNGVVPQANTLAPTRDAQAPDAGTLGEVSPQNDYLFGAPGCVDWPSWKAAQVPWDRYAWGSGWSKAGPSWYGEGGHINCNSPGALNDYHAIDFPMYEWNSLYAPAAGRVIYAGWATGGWASAGRVVILDLGNGYWSGSFHLRSIAVSAGQYVNTTTRIGYVGGSGYGRDGYFGNHLHQGLYLNARLYASNGGVYGGQSVEPHYWRRTSDGGMYTDIGRWAWMRY
jgi:murein DD-endopeptidase MepM/ murein hydrolase activator NlpD